ALVIHFTKYFLGEDFMNIPEMKPFYQMLTLSERGLAIKGDSRRKINTLMKELPELNGLQRLSHLLSIFNILSKNQEYKTLASPSFIQNYQNSCSQQFADITGYIIQNYDK